MKRTTPGIGGSFEQDANGDYWPLDSEGKRKTSKPLPMDRDPVPDDLLSDAELAEKNKPAVPAFGMHSGDEK